MAESDQRLDNHFLNDERIPMHPKIPINLQDLLRQRTIGFDRIQQELAMPPEGVTVQVTTDVTPGEGRVIAALQGELTRQAPQEAPGLEHAEHFRKSYLLPALASGMVEMTLPDMPRSSEQRYRPKAQGQQWLDTQREGR